MKPIKKTFAFGRHQVTLETGEIARQAGGAVLVNMDDTVVLATVVAELFATVSVPAEVLVMDRGPVPSAVPFAMVRLPPDHVVPPV